MDQFLLFKIELSGYTHTTYLSLFPHQFEILVLAYIKLSYAIVFMSGFSSLLKILLRILTEV